MNFFSKKTKKPPELKGSEGFSFLIKI